MTEQPATARAREYLEAFEKNDVEAMRDFFADDIVWHVAGNHPLSGDYRGKDQLFEYFETVRELTGGTLRLEAQSILASDQHMARFTRATASRQDRSFDVLLVQIYKVGADGRWTEYWALADDQEALDAFWS